MRTVIVYSSFSDTALAVQRRRVKKAPRSVSPGKIRIDYSKFSHATHVTKQQLNCSSCHKFPTENWKQVRKGEAAFPDVADFPDHSSCLSCHREQFFARERPAPMICSNCHVNVTPRDTARFLFPSLGDVGDALAPRREVESEFAVNFPHELHLDVVGLNDRRPVGNSAFRFIDASWRRQKKTPPLNCPICHQTYQPQGNSSEEYVTKAPANLGDSFWLKKGTFKTVPNAHTGCFTCHNEESGIAPLSGECQVCHKLAGAAKLEKDFDPVLPVTMEISDRVMLNRWRRRISAGTFRHEGGAHPDLLCTDCHRPSQMNTADAQTLRVSVRSCGGADGCHITPTADEGGILNYEIEKKKESAGFVCTKCHITFGKQTIPKDHGAAIPTPASPGKPTE